MEPFWICQKESSTCTSSIRSVASSSISSASLHLPNRNYKWYSIRQFLQLQHHLALELKPAGSSSLTTAVSPHLSFRTWFDLIGLWRGVFASSSSKQTSHDKQKTKGMTRLFSILSELNGIKWDWIEWLSNWVNERENGIVGMGVSEWVREQSVCVCVCTVGRQTATITVQQIIPRHTKKWSLIRLCTPFYVPFPFGKYKDDSILETSTSVR